MSGGAGFFFAREISADNRELLDAAFRSPDDFAAFGTCGPKMVRRNAERDLAIMNSFPPGVAHQREKTQRVEIHRYQAPAWKISESRAHPEGSCVLEAAYDLSKLVREGLTSPTEELGEVVHDLGDGTVIRGLRVRVSPHSGLPGNREIDLPFLVLHYDASSFSSTGDFSYVFKLKSGLNAAAAPFKLVIREEVMVDNVPISRKVRECLPIFERKGGRVGKFIAYRKKETEQFLLDLPRVV